MLNTARFVAEAGGQAELVLRARQSTNPHFAFLRPDSRLQPYFRWLVRAQPQVCGHSLLAVRQKTRYLFSWVFGAGTMSKASTSRGFDLHTVK